MPEGLLDPLLEELGRLRRYRGSPSLASLRRVLAATPAAPWWRQLDAIKITGSNGKGSVAAMVAVLLSAAGVRTGLFLSPHLQHFCERFSVDGEPLPESLVLGADARLRQARRAAELGEDDLIAFEAITGLAVEAFAAAQVEAVVAEAGIGGRYDATRLLPGHLHALVSVDLEHRGLLGDNLLQIGRHKAQIAEPGGRLLLGDLPADVVGHLVADGRRRGVEVIPRSGIEVVALEICDAHMELDLRVDGSRFPSVRIHLLGAHQAVNCGLAIRLARGWLRRHRPSLAEDDPFRRFVQEALPRLRLPGRGEWLGEDPAVWVDTAHTPAALRGLRRLLPTILMARPWILLCGVSEDKAPTDLLSPLLAPQQLASQPSSAPLRPPEAVIISRAAQRGGHPQRIVDWLAGLAKVGPYEVVEPLEAGLAVARDRARHHGGVVVVAGGLFLAAEVRQILEPNVGGAPSYY